jgi:hypothetical protein
MSKAKIFFGLGLEALGDSSLVFHIYRGKYYPNQWRGSSQTMSQTAMALDGCEPVYTLEYPSSMMRPEVPNEIWTLIAQFIPSHVLWELRTVNSAFLQAALDDRYRVFQLVDCDLNDRGWARTLSRWEKMR